MGTQLTEQSGSVETNQTFTRPNGRPDVSTTDGGSLRRTAAPTEMLNETRGAAPHSDLRRPTNEHRSPQAVIRLRQAAGRRRRELRHRRRRPRPRPDLRRHRRAAPRRDAAALRQKPALSRPSRDCHFPGLMTSCFSVAAVVKSRDRVDNFKGGVPWSAREIQLLPLRNFREHPSRATLRWKQWRCNALSPTPENACMGERCS